MNIIIIMITMIAIIRILRIYIYISLPWGTIRAKLIRVLPNSATYVREWRYWKLLLRRFPVTPDGMTPSQTWPGSTTCWFSNRMGNGSPNSWMVVSRGDKVPLDQGGDIYIYIYIDTQISLRHESIVYDSPWSFLKIPPFLLLFFSIDIYLSILVENAIFNGCLCTRQRHLISFHMIGQNNFPLKRYFLIPSVIGQYRDVLWRIRWNHYNEIRVFKLEYIQIQLGIDIQRTCLYIQNRYTYIYIYLVRMTLNTWWLIISCIATPGWKHQ
jgi:hypothetical protein